MRLCRCGETLVGGSVVVVVVVVVVVRRLRLSLGLYDGSEELSLGLF
jgi:hypothetical protein